MTHIYYTHIHTLIAHKYCAHRKNTGISAVLMKNPANSSCGTNSKGANSATSLTSFTRQPILYCI